MTPLATCQLWNLLNMWAIRDDSRSVQQRRTSSYHMTMPRTPPLGWETRSTGFVHCSPVHLRILPAHTPGTSGTTGSDQGDISESDHHECNPHVNAHHCQRLVNGCHMASTSTGGEMGWGQCHLNPRSKTPPPKKLLFWEVLHFYSYFLIQNYMETFMTHCMLQIIVRMPTGILTHWHRNHTTHSHFQAYLKKILLLPIWNLSS